MRRLKGSLFSLPKLTTKMAVVSDGKGKYFLGPFGREQSQNVTLRHCIQAVGPRSAALSLRGARSCLLGSLRSQPNDRSLCSLIVQLVTLAQSLSNFVIHNVIAMLINSQFNPFFASRNWSHLVTNHSLVTDGHMGHTLAIRYPSWKEISARTETRTVTHTILY